MEPNGDEVFQTFLHTGKVVITSGVSGRGNVFRPIRPSVCPFTLSRPKRLTYGHQMW